MSGEILVQLASGCSLDQLRECVERITGERLIELVDSHNVKMFTTCENSRYFTTIMDVSKDLSDGWISQPFDRLPKTISLDPYPSPPGQDYAKLCRELAIQIGRTVFQELRCDCVVVENYGRAVAIFKSPDNDWLVLPE